MKKFDNRNTQLLNQFENIEWIENSGLNLEDLLSKYNQLMEQDGTLSKAVIKAKTFELLANHARIAIDKDDIFQDKLYAAEKLIEKQRNTWYRYVGETYLKEKRQIKIDATYAGAFTANCDFGHTSPNTRLLLEVGFPGLVANVEKAASRENLTDAQKDFYNACIITLNAAITFIKRLSDAIKPYNKENADALLNLTLGAPSNTYEAMQLLIVYFFFHEYVGGTRVRTLGRLDVLLYPYYKQDIETGVYTKEDVYEMLKFFLNKLWSAKVPYDLPFCLGGVDIDGTEATNEMSYMIVKAYDSLNIYSPKIHIRVSDKTPVDFIKLVLDCIRNGNSSFVFINDDVAMKSLKLVGIEDKDLPDYVPIGCYEPAVWGMEIGCTGNGWINLAKAVEFIFTNGVDDRTGLKIGLDVGKIESFEAFIDAIKAQLRYMTDLALDYVILNEIHYDKVNPDPLLSAMYTASVENGVDVYSGGAKYNNSSYYFMCIGSLIDSVLAVKKLVFEDKIVTLEAFGEILKNNWEGHEDLRQKALHECLKYGNDNKVADDLTVEFTDFVAQLANNRPNGRGGVFKSSIFTIDRFIELGERTMATPDGRKKGEVLSKNLSATIGMDKNGITALINSVTKIDFSKFPNGSVLDVLLHPTLIRGDKGLDAFYGILSTYFNQGGFAMHGNVFNVETLKDAQENPEKYKTLQVRLCGWNAYFVNLSKAEQDSFIRQAEKLV